MNFIQTFYKEWKTLLTTDRLIFISALFIPVICSGFFFFPTKILRILFYCSLPFSIALIWRDWRYIWDMIKTYKYIWAICIGFLAYMSLSVGWAYTTEENRYFEKGKLGILILTSLLSTFYVTHKFPKIIKTIAISFVAAAVISGIIVVISYILTSSDMTYFNRLHGMGRAENPVQAALLYGLSIILIAYGNFSVPIKIYHRLALSIIPLITLFCTQSRGPLIALCIALSTIFLIRAHRKHLALSIILVGLLVASLIGYNALKNTAFIERQSGGRTEIWLAAFNQIKEHPIIGHGLANKTIYTYTNPYHQIERVGHAHSLYLSTLIQGGIIGLALLIGLIFVTLKSSISLKEKHMDNRLGCHGNNLRDC